MKLHYHQAPGGHWVTQAGYIDPRDGQPAAASFAGKHDVSAVIGMLDFCRKRDLLAIEEKYSNDRP